MILSFVLFLKILAFSIYFYNLKRFLNNICFAKHAYIILFCIEFPSANKNLSSWAPCCWQKLSCSKVVQILQTSSYWRQWNHQQESQTVGEWDPHNFSKLGSVRFSKYAIEVSLDVTVETELFSIDNDWNVSWAQNLHIRMTSERLCDGEEKFSFAIIRIHFIFKYMKIKTVV